MSLEKLGVFTYGISRHFAPDSGNLWNMIGFGRPAAFILNNLKYHKGEGKCVHK